MTARILVIDDDERLTSMLSEYLGGRGFETVVENDPRPGLARARQEPFDALILDVMLPEVDGFEILTELRRASDIPVLMLTARGDEMDRIVGLELGADDYLPKPFNPRELLARLRALTRRRRVSGSEATPLPPPPPLRFGALTIDPRERSVHLGGQLRSLTSYQFDLLMALATNAGRVMSRKALAAQVRGVTLSAFDRSIDVHVSRIRAAIEREPKAPRRIVTIRGVGYLFKGNPE